MHGLYGFPEEYTQFVRETQTRIDRVGTETLGMVCWKKGISGGPTHLSGEVMRLRWRHGDEWQAPTDEIDKQWKQIPCRIVKMP